MSANVIHPRANATKRFMSEEFQVLPFANNMTNVQ